MSSLAQKKLALQKRNEAIEARRREDAARREAEFQQGEIEGNAFVDNGARPVSTAAQKVIDNAQKAKAKEDRRKKLGFFDGPSATGYMGSSRPGGTVVKGASRDEVLAAKVPEKSTSIKNTTTDATSPSSKTKSHVKTSLGPASRLEAVAATKKGVAKPVKAKRVVKSESESESEQEDKASRKRRKSVKQAREQRHKEMFGFLGSEKEEESN